MIEPKPYSNTDAFEREAIDLLENILNKKYVKTDLAKGDKTPNHDGYIEIVNEALIPIGKVNVQIKKIPKGQTHYDCPVELVGYSQKVSLPFILICVDTDNKLAFWKQIYQNMAEFQGKEKQKTFVIHFSNPSDVIDNNSDYLQKWINLVVDYNNRTSNYPSLSSIVAKLDLSDINPNDITLFLQYIDSINHLLDFDFPVIKDIVFPGAWKIGVAIISSKDNIHYQIYKIPWNNPGQMLVKLQQPILKGPKEKYKISEVWTPRQYFNNPKETGKEFVFEHVRKVIQQLALPVYGVMMASDVLTNFIDRYSICLDLPKYQQSYNVKDISNSITRLSQIASSLIGKIAQNINGIFIIDVDTHWHSQWHFTVQASLDLNPGVIATLHTL